MQQRPTKKTRFSHFFYERRGYNERMDECSRYYIVKAAGQTPN